MDFTKIASNPWVWGAGVVLGVLVMASRGGSPAAVTGYDPNVLLGLNQIAAANNEAAMGFSAQMATIAANRSRDNNAANLTRDLKVIDAVNRGNEVASTVAVAMMESAAGVTKERIQAGTALVIDRQTNETRREMTYVAGRVSDFATQAAAAIEAQKTDAALKAQTQANQINGDNAWWGNILGFAGNLLKFFW